MLPVVLTSLNPSGRLPYQVRCLGAWRDLGFEATSFNTAGESAALAAAGAPLGLPAEALAGLEDEQTGLALHGKPVPKVSAMLRIAEARWPGRPVLLVNSDLYPAARDAGFALDWLAEAPLLALTRQETPILEAATLAGVRPYRGGLDAFAIGADVLPRLTAALADDPVSERMCFGIVGWDYFLGAMAMARFGGTALDSGLLLHEWHLSTYSAIDEFGHYVPAMAAMGAVSATDPIPAAEEMAARIDRACAGSRARSERIAALHFRAPAMECGPDLRQRAPARSLALRLQSLAPWIEWNYDFGALVALLARALSGEPFDFARLAAFFRTGPSVDHRFAETLLAVLVHFEVSRALVPEGPALAGAPSGGLRPLSGDYPPNQLHGQVVLGIARETVDRPALRRLRLLDLCGAEMVDEAILNRRLLDWITLACMNDAERRLVAEIRAHLGGMPRASAPPDLRPKDPAHAY